MVYRTIGLSERTYRLSEWTIKLKGYSQEYYNLFSVWNELKKTLQGLAGNVGGTGLIAIHTIQ